MTEKLEKLISKKNQLTKQIEQEQFQLKQSQYSKNWKERKERTRLLIQKGALLDKYFQTTHLNPKETEELLKTFADYINANKPEKYKKG